MYAVKTPSFLHCLFPSFLWRVPTEEAVVYLTFDDGPIPELTPWVLDELRQWGAKATFFCVGDNVRKYGEIYEQVIAEGHAVGNHTFNHLNGWNTENSRYIDNVALCADWVDSGLFRPPYGRIRPRQTQALLPDYKIVMWDVLSGDFDRRISPEQCLKNVETNTVEGSVVVFHDNIKAEERLRYALPRFLEKFTKRGYAFEALPQLEAAASPAPPSIFSK